MTASRLITSLAIGLASIALSGAQDADVPTMCSCSPTTFTFVLSLDQTCDDNDIELNDGIDGSFCFTEEGVTIPAPPEPEDDGDDADDEPADDEPADGEPADGEPADGEPDQEPATEPAEMEMCSFCPDGLENPDLVLTDPDTGLSATCQEASDAASVSPKDSSECLLFGLGQPLCCPNSAVETSEPVRRRRRRRTQHRVLHRMPLELRQTVEDGDFVARSLQETTDDPVTEIVSVQFLEFDTSGDLTVINQDDTYADVTLANGDRIKFESASSFLDTNKTLEEQMSGPALVPGGASLILYGKTAGGKVVRNRFFWMYDMNCGRENEPIKVDDEIGWVTVAEISNAWPAFCPALPADSPTIAPRTNEPTLTPSESPTVRPTDSPAMSMRPTTSAPSAKPVSSPTEWSGSHPDGPVFGGKSGKAPKAPKTMKPAKASKAVDPKSAKSSKSAKSAKGSKMGSGDDGHVVDGKTWKPAGWDYVQYGMEGYSKFDAEKTNGSSSASSLFGLGIVVSLVASVLLARQ